MMDALFTWYLISVESYQISQLGNFFFNVLNCSTLPYQNKCLPCISNSSQKKKFSAGLKNI